MIGFTENALRALLTSTLSSTRISTYPEWVILNAASNTDPTWHQAVADALKIELGGVAQVIAGLRTAGLMDDGEALTEAGATELRAARSAVAATTSLLMDGISDAEQETAEPVLDRIRGNAQELLRRDAQRRSEATSHRDSDRSRR